MDSLSIEIGKRISSLRKQNKITQEVLASMLDISEKHMSSVERGKSSLSLEKLVRAAEILDTDLNYLVLGKTYHNYAIPLPDSILSILEKDNEEELALLSEYLQLYKKLREGK